MTALPVHLSVLIPAFNEAARIGQTLEELQAWFAGYPHDWEIRVVDDGSLDETADIVARASLADPRVVLQREPHRGKGGAVRSGFLKARGALRFACDADLSAPVHEIDRFLEMVPAQCDIAIGSREGVGARRIGEPMYRHLMGRAFNALVRASLLPGIQDTQCGFKMFTAQAVEAVFPSTTIDGWAFDIEVMLIARLQGWRIREMPLEWQYRKGSQVSVARDSFRMVRDLSRIRANARVGAYDGGVTKGRKQGNHFPCPRSRDTR